MVNRTNLGRHTNSCGCFQREAAFHRKWKDVVDYAAVHRRIVKARGSASTHTCVDCGDPAEDWSYDHDDPNALIGAPGRKGAGRPYSLLMEHYVPRCRVCHRRLDHGRVAHVT